MSSIVPVLIMLSILPIDRKLTLLENPHHYNAPHALKNTLKRPLAYKQKCSNSAMQTRPK